MKRLLLSLAAVVCLAAGQASANIIYTFSGLAFDDGGSLTGTFETNDAITSLIDFDLTTSGGAAVGFHYTPGTVGSGSTSLPSILVLSTASLDHLLQVTFAGGLSPSGAPVLVGTFDSFEQSGTARRDISPGGSVTVGTTVPEPATLGLLALGLLGVLGSVRRGRER